MGLHKGCKKAPLRSPIPSTLSQPELEWVLLWFLLFATEDDPISCAHRFTRFIRKYERFTSAEETPFSAVIRCERYQTIDLVIRTCGCSKPSTAVKRAVGAATSKLILASCTHQELAKLPGITLEITRLFLLATRPASRYAVIDEHVVKWLDSTGYGWSKNKKPKSKAVYEDCEREVLTRADREGVDAGEICRRAWSEMGVEDRIWFRSREEVANGEP